MSYAISDIISWAEICQPLAAFGESKKKATIYGSPENDLDVQLYNARKDLEYSYAQDPSGDITFQIGQYVLSLCGVYLLQAQSITGGGGSITPIEYDAAPDPYDFYVSGGSFISTGVATKIISNFAGWNMLFVRGGITQSKTDPGDGSTWYSWDKSTATFTLNNGVAQAGENFQIYPIV